MAFSLAFFIAHVILIINPISGMMPGFFPGMSGMMGGMSGMSGAFPSFGGMGMAPPGQNSIDPMMMTCINADIQDPHSQMRMTLTPMRSVGRGMNNMDPFGIGMRGAITMGPGSRDASQVWDISGFILPSQLVQKRGTYQLALFEGGRTHGQCQSEALGQVMDTVANPLNRMGIGSMGRHPGMMGMMGMMGPLNPMMNPYSMFMTSLLSGQQRTPSGVVSNPLIVGDSGPTMYSGTVSRLSFNDLNGRSLAACQSIINGQCAGLISFCCSITRDRLSASETYVSRAALNMQSSVPVGGAPIMPGGVTFIEEQPDLMNSPF